MNDPEPLRALLRGFARRSLLLAAARATAATIALGATVALALALVAATTGPAAFWPKLTALAALALALGCVLAGAILPYVRLRSDRALAALVGRHDARVADDLRSALAFERGGAAPAGAPRSEALVRAFRARVAASVAHLDPTAVVPARGLRPALLGAVIALAAFAALARVGPERIATGLATMTATPSRFAGAVVAREPLLRDIRLRYSYPGYTGLPPRDVTDSTGDIAGLRGAHVRLSATPARPARAAYLLVGERGETEIPARLRDGRLEIDLPLSESGLYRVLLEPAWGRSVREERSHQIVVEPDRAPEIDIQGPAERLELDEPRPVEVGYAARDDFGLGAVELVMRVDDGGEERRPLVDAKGDRRAGGKTLLDLGALALRSGSRVAYRVEARDLDTIAGPKIGVSRTLYVTVANPVPDVDARLQRAGALLDRWVDNLAERLEIGEAPAAGDAGAADPQRRLALWSRAHENAQGALALLGQLVDDAKRRRGPHAGLLSSLASRLGEHVRTERGLLAGARAAADRRGGAADLRRVEAAGPRHVGALENAILILDDVIGRQRLDDLAAMGRELADAHKQLQDLVARYQATRDPTLRVQLERAIRDLGQRIEALAQKIASVRARDEIAQEWQNLPDLGQARAEVQRFEELLRQGDPASLSGALAELGARLEDVRKTLEDNAGAFERQRFPQQSRALAELTKQLGDLEGDQRAIAAESRALADEVRTRNQAAAAARMEELVQELERRAGDLQRQLATTPPVRLRESARDDLRRARDAAAQLRRLIPAREWGEARRETGRAVDGVGRVRDRWSALDARGRAGSTFDRDLDDAKQNAEEIAKRLDELEKLEAIAQEEAARARSRSLGQRQEGTRGRAARLAEGMADKDGLLPEAAPARATLREVAGKMGEAGRSLGQDRVREGAQQAEDAANRLAELRHRLNQRGADRGGNNREPVRIPEAGESKAPREWRQELLEAMRERAPDAFRAEIRRYYEELVK